MASFLSRWTKRLARAVPLLVAAAAAVGALAFIVSAARGRRRVALFPPWVNGVVPVVLVLAVAAGAAVPIFLMAWVRSPQATGEGRAIAQPVAFSHQLHVTGFRIDCRYCHAAVERSASAGFPATATCVPCHSPVWMNGPLMKPVRRSMASRRPIEWRRVYELPDFVFFDHAIHVNKGVGCETCHGRVDRMARVSQVVPLTMSWCLDCHRQPARYLRPVEAMTTMGWSPSRPRRVVGAEVARRYHVQPLTTCTACHR